jgi:hypothetical protein
MKAHEFFSQGDCWCQEHFAIDANNKPISDESDPSICKRCIVGGINFCYPDLDEAYEAQKRVYDVLYNKHKCTDLLIQWNDKPGRAREEVVALLKEADV